MPAARRNPIPNTATAQQPVDPRAKWRAIGLLTVCCVMALSVWFSSAAILPILKRQIGLSASWGALSTSAVALGFVAGTLVSAGLGLADRLDPRRFFMTCCFIAAAANAAMVWADPAGLTTLALRAIAGAAMAGVYPVGMKMASAWADGDRGVLVGLLVGAVTLGSAMPHLIGVFSLDDWRGTLLISSALAAAAGIAVTAVEIGPGYARATAFKPSQALAAFTHRPLRLANLGYFGHMWELYAMWSWVGLFLAASFAQVPGFEHADYRAKLATFAAVGAGAVGCLIGGIFADRLGRTAITSGAMAVSGLCALTVGFLFGANPILLTALCIIWGVAVVADSAQFSASVMELSEPELAGTMVTVQTSIGFLLTIVTIQLTPLIVDMVGWRYGFTYLAAGPLIGIIAMLRLRRLPEARKLAGGRR
jgi:MFS family permease